MSVQSLVATIKKGFEGPKNLGKVLFGSDEIEETELDDFASTPDDAKVISELKESQKRIAEKFKDGLSSPTPKRTKMVSKENIEKLKNMPIDQRPKEVTKKSDEIEPEL